MKRTRLKRILILLLTISLITAIPANVSAASKLDTPEGFEVWTDSCYEGFLSWETVKKAKYYEIYRSQNEKKNYKKIAATRKTTYTDKSLSASKTYYYKIRAVSIECNSPYSAVQQLRTTARPNGNASCYNLENVSFMGDSALTGKTLFFLGSSVTYGYRAGGISFADYLGKRNGTNIKKEAVSGTSIAKNNSSKGKSYVERINKLDGEVQPDIFVCQIPYNDVIKGSRLGEVIGPEGKSFNKSTVGGAIDYITNYAVNRWPDAQIVFYTISKNSNSKYSKYVKMINLLYDAQSKWGKNKYGENTIEIIDLWNNSAISSIRGNDYVLYMFDTLHPTKAGYLLLWTPYFEEKLMEFIHVDKDETVNPTETVESESVAEDNYENTVTEDADGEMEQNPIPENNENY